MQLLVISTMYPNRVTPVHAVFIQQRILAMSKYCDLKVISPIPYFPFFRIFKRYRQRKQIPQYENQDGINVFFPRYLSIPHFFKPLEAFSLALSVKRLIKKEKLDFDIIESHLPFPEGFASVMLGNLYGKPVSTTLRGHDMNVLPAFPVRNRMISYTLKKCIVIFSVAKALKNAAVDLGADKKKVIVLGNGVDPKRFYPYDNEGVRKRLGLLKRDKVVLCVGHLVERKGVHLVVRALDKLRQSGRVGIHLIVIGAPGEEGDFLQNILQEISELGLKKYVHMVGAIDNQALYRWYSAADIFCLASSKEGWPNVLLESLACGTPVVATKVWGTPEVIKNASLGVLVERNVDSIANGLNMALSKEWDQDVLISYARSFTWDKIAQKVYSLYREILAEV